MAFKSKNQYRTGHAQGSNVLYEKSTDCYIKMNDDPNKKQAIEYYDFIDSDCMEEDSSG